jgi:hypothetical protein
MVPGLILAVLFMPMYWLYGHGPLPVGEP